MSLLDLIIDACGWAAVVDARLNIDLELLSLMGRPRWVLPEGVKAELERLAQTRQGLLLDLLFSRAVVEATNGGWTHPDDHVVHIAGTQDAAVLTVDRALKGRLMQAGIPIIEVVDGARLRKVDP